MWGTRIATASVRTGFAMTGLCKRCGVRADVGSELSAAGGRSIEVSEWPRSKFPASAVRQHRNFGHRNRIIGPSDACKRCVGADRGIGPYGEAARGAGKESPSHGFAVPAPFRQGGRGGGGDGLPRALCALAMTGGFGNKKGMPVRASLLRFYAGAIALARVCAYSISRRFDCLASWVTLGRISSRTPLSYLALMLAVSMPATLKLRL